MREYRRLTLALALGFALALAGCGTETVTVKAYDGPDRPAAQLSSIRLQSGIFIGSIDDKYARGQRTENMFGGLTVDILVPPGHHVAFIGYWYGTPGSPTGGSTARNILVEFDTVAGRRYFIKSTEPAPRLWAPMIMDVTDRTDCDHPMSVCP